MATPSASIFWNRNKGTYLFQEHMPSPLGGSRDLGEPILVKADEFDSRIAGLVLDSLASYQQRVYDPKMERRSSDKERLNFVKEHLLVVVAIIPSGQVRVSACGRRGLSYGGVKDGEVVVDAISAMEKLPGAIRDAFSKAV
jgi:hypothetical protein